ncbi:MAG: hypothetical protein JWQ97_1037 [Phenylobacterium sp.]|nr:hypothetical protein [Phenylobacterium sp.]
MRVGFLFNHDQAHQVAHSLPIALSLARQAPELQVVLATTNRRLRAEVLRLSRGVLPRQVELVSLEARPSFGRRVQRLLEPILPVGKLAIYGDNLDFFRALDVLVVAEKTSLLLKTRHGLDRLRIVHTRHGAGDRAIGFDPASRRFDHVLASGRKIADRLTAEAGVDPRAISIVGYPKFDIVPPPKRLPLQANGKPTVLYNPHASPHLSSWYAQGRSVLDYFRGNPDYNLIFAPHVMLFARPVTVSIDRLRVAVPGRIDPALHAEPNILIDLGSAACTDMTYTSAADIYLGDVSSQVYEFLREPRPCVFLDPNRRAYADDPNFAHWKAGRVITEVADLDRALREATRTHADYLPTQQALFDYSFDLTDERSCDRAARAVRQFAARGADAVVDS